MNKRKIRIFDDETGLRQVLKEKVKGSGLDQDEFDIDTVPDREFNKALEDAAARQRVFRESGEWNHDGSNLLDDVEILVVDYDLFETQPFMTADRVAYLVRCFTACGIIVVLNRSGHNPFDLTLKDHPESFADLDIGQNQLDNPFLWGIGKNEFAPWYWPALPKLAKDFLEKIGAVEQGLETGKTIWELLGFPPSLTERLPLEMTRFVDPSGENGRLAHFVLSSDYGLENKDRAKAVTDDEVTDPKTIARVAAARIGKWLEYFVLPELDILMDAPHLISRMPGLMGGDLDMSTWNKVTKRHVKDSKDIPEMKTELIEEFRFKEAHWLSRPAWFWKDIIEKSDIEDVRTPWQIKRPDFFFCEDTSSFHPRNECHEFQAQTSVSPLSERYILSVDEVDYMPRTRLAL